MSGTIEISVDVNKPEAIKKIAQKLNEIDPDHSYYEDAQFNMMVFLTNDHPGLGVSCMAAGAAMVIRK